MPSVVGVLAVQGDFEKHVRAVTRCGAHAREVRTPEQLAGVDRLIIPGGESTTVGLLLERYGLGKAIKKAARKGMPLWGTCMGLILMAREIEGRPEQYTLGLMDVDVRRNAFGAQIHSFEDKVTFRGLEKPVLGVFIRAPIVTRTGPHVQELAKYRDEIVAVREGKLLGTSFHPELTDELALHRWFLSI